MKLLNIMLFVSLALFWPVQTVHAQGTAGVMTRNDQAISGVKTFSDNVGIGTTVPTGILHVSTGPGTSNLLVDSSNGNVGIGTSAPANKLHVQTDGNPAKFESTSGNGRIEIDAPSTKNAGVQFFENNVLRWGIFNQGSDDSLKIQNKDFSTKLAILQDGNVGIGVLDPDADLEVKSNAAATGFALNVSSQNGTGMFVVQGNGDVGIGTATPSKSLDVAGDVQFGCPSGMTSFGRGCVSGVRTAGTWETVISDCRTTFNARICTYLDIQQACAAGAITSVGSTISWFGDHTGDNTVLVSFEDTCNANIDGAPEPTSNSRPGRCCL